MTVLATQAITVRFNFNAPTVLRTSTPAITVALPSRRNDHQSCPMISHELKTPLSDYLESIGDSRTCLKDGKEGLEPIKKEGHNYDAIILDLAMPDIKKINSSNVVKILIIYRLGCSISNC
jgi:hypothetical protein